MGELPRVDLLRYEDAWEPDDPHANFKREVAEWTRLDPLPTFEQLSATTGVPIGALLRYALARWAAEGSEALLALGPRTVERLWQIIRTAEAAGSDAARLEAYARLRDLLGWLRLALAEDPEPGEAPGPRSQGA